MPSTHSLLLDFSQAFARLLPPTFFDQLASEHRPEELPDMKGMDGLEDLLGGGTGRGPKMPF